MRKKLLEDLLTNASFVCWIRNEATYEEEKYWQNWYQKDPDRKYIVEEARAVLSSFEQVEHSMPDIGIELQKLEHILDQDEQQSKVLRLRSNRQQFRKRKRFIAAAILIAGVCIGALIANQYQILGVFEETELAEASHYQEYKTDYGEKVTFRLSDNSRIVLNANSYIRFSTEKDGSFNTKEVWLEGEAYFDITNFDDVGQRTFAVNTSDGSVQVLGTSFAVKTFEGRTRAVLEKGSVVVEVFTADSESVGNYRESVILEPGEMALFSTGNENIAVSRVNPKVYTSWYEDLWFFDDTPISEIATRIEDTFGLSVNVENALKDRKLSGSIKSTNLEVLHEALSAILKVPVEQVGQEIFIGKGERLSSGSSVG